MVWLRRLAVGVAAICLFLLLTIWLFSPLISRWVINEVLESRAVSLTPESVIRLNPFGSNLSIHNLQLQGRSKSTLLQLETLQVHYRLHRLLFKEVHIDKIHLKGLHLDAVINDDSMTIAGFNLSGDSRDDELKGVASEGVLSKDLAAEESEAVSDIRLLAPSIVFEDLNFNIRHFDRLHNMHFEKITIDQSAYEKGIANSAMTVKGLLNNAPISLLSRVHYASDDAEVSLELGIQSLDLQPFDYLLPEDIRQLNALVDVTLKTALSQKAGAINVAETQLQLTVQDLLLVTQGIEVTLDSHRLQVMATDIVLDEQQSLAVSATFESDIKKFSVNVEETKDLLLAFDALLVSQSTVNVQQKNFELNTNSLMINNLQASQVHASDQSLPVLTRIDHIRLNNIDLRPDQLVLDALMLSDGEVNALLDKEGGLQTMVDISGLIPVGEATVESAVSESTASESNVAEQAQLENREKIASEKQAMTADGSPNMFGIKINKVYVDKPIAIKLVDESHVPNYKNQFFIETFAINNIDNQMLEQWTDFQLKVNDGKYFLLDAKGKAQPFEEKVNAELEANVKEFSLPEVSPYLAKHLDFEFKAGQLDSDLTAKVVDSELDAKINLLMRATDFSASQDDVEKTNVIGQAAIPLNVALGMLKDGDGNIDLSIPLDGNINDPNFGMQYILALVVKKAAMNKAKSYLMNTFVPYAQVISIGMAAGSYALKVRFEDLHYVPGQVDIDDHQLEFSEQLATLMQDKKDLTVKVCPFVTPQDIAATNNNLTEAQRGQLNDIASQRAAAFKANIVNKGIDSSRLLICSPKVDVSKKSVTRLEFSV